MISGTDEQLIRVVLFLLAGSLPSDIPVQTFQHMKTIARARRAVVQGHTFRQPIYVSILTVIISAGT